MGYLKGKEVCHTVNGNEYLLYSLDSSLVSIAVRMLTLQPNTKDFPYPCLSPQPLYG